MRVQRKASLDFWALPPIVPRSSSPCFWFRFVKIRIQQFRQARTELQFEVPVEELRAHFADVGSTYEDAGFPAQFEGIVDRTDDVLQIRGVVTLRYTLVCSRCVAERDRESALPVRWTLVPLRTLDTHRLRDDEEVELSTDDLDVSFYSGDEIDLGELVREALILELDPSDECGEEACDERLAKLIAEPDPSADQEVVDPRWAGLADLKSKMKR